MNLTTTNIFNQFLDKSNFENLLKSAKNNKNEENEKKLQDIFYNLCIQINQINLDNINNINNNILFWGNVIKLINNIIAQKQFEDILSNQINSFLILIFLANNIINIVKKEPYDIIQDKINNLKKFAYLVNIDILTALLKIHEKIANLNPKKTIFDLDKINYKKFFLFLLIFYTIFGLILCLSHIK